MSVLKTECESGLMPPRAAGKRSRAILGADERRREESISGTFLKSASKPLATQSLHRHCVASGSSLVYVLCGVFMFAWRVVNQSRVTYLRRQLASLHLWHIAGELQERKSVSARTLKIQSNVYFVALPLVFLLNPSYWYLMLPHIQFCRCTRCLKNFLNLL